MQLSDGSLSLVGHITILCSPVRPGVICLEEPESGLTPKAIKALMRAVESAAAGAPAGERHRWPSQIVIATHSPYLLSWAWEHIGHKSVSEVQFGAGRSEVVPFSDAHPDIDPDGALGPNAAVSALGWHFG